MRDATGKALLPTCACGHSIGVHRLGGAPPRTRKSCTAATGRNGTPCPCHQYVPEVPA
jgi:hypothetical protein